MSSLDRSTWRTRLLDHCRADERIRAVVDYGSDALGRGDAYSDLDLLCFVAEEAVPAFASGWRQWVEGVGEPLLVYDAGGHQRAVLPALPLPLRVDLGFWSEARIDELRELSQRPRRADDMVAFDRTPGQRCRAAVAELVAAPEHTPADLAREFEHIAGDLFYYLLRVLGLLRRGELPAAVAEHHWFVVGNLASLMRIEAEALAEWRCSLPQNRLAARVSAERFRELSMCLPDAASVELERALYAAADLGAELCAGLATRHGWTWPRALAAEVARLLRSSGSDS